MRCPLKTTPADRPAFRRFFQSEANADGRTSGETEMKTKIERESNMKTTNQNLKKATAGAEAPHQSDQSAKRVADQIGGIPEYREKVTRLLLNTCAMFGGEIVKVTL